MITRILTILVAVTGLWSFAGGAPSFAAPEISGLDWNAVRDELRPRVLQATTRRRRLGPLAELRTQEQTGGIRS